MAGKKIKFRIQGHEKFPLREGWLHKGLEAVHNDHRVFLGGEGADIFGIGSNMVKSLRYWMKAYGLMRESSSNGAELTLCGNIIYEHDPYFEDVFTLWILHSNIARNIEEATSWYMYFNRCDADELDKEQIFVILKREIFKYVNGQSFSDQTLKNDIDVLLATYSKGKEVYDPEDKNISPLTQLSLVRMNDRRYSKNKPDRRMISEWIVLYELSLLMKDKRSISIDEVTTGEKSLGAIFNMTVVLSNEFLDKLDARGLIKVDRTAGLDMIYKTTELDPDEIMKEYYMHR